jgi:hypothetical protein
VPARPRVLVSGALVSAGLLRWLGWGQRAIERAQGIAPAPDEVVVVEDGR